jgi:predicted nuclease of predicted toxin-antitoxin system
MRLKVDENLPRAVCDLLNRAGHDVISVGEQGLGGADDARI